MNPKRILVTVPTAIVLAAAGFVMGSGAQTPGVVQIAGVIVPSFTPTATDTPPPTWTSTATNTPAPTSTPTSSPTPTDPRIPTPTYDPKLRTVRVPILMYHYISVPPPDADIYRLDLSVTPAAFEAQMEYLAAEGYHPIRVSDLADHLLNGTLLPPKPIVLTFDDGYDDNYENAFPVLKKYKFPATFFVITQFVDDKKPAYMTWDQLEEMAIEGMEIGSHTLDHIDLRGKPRSVQASELVGSKAMIESRIGTPVKSFCYPSGSYDAQTIGILRSTGYLAATTEIQGTYQSTRDLYQLRRIRVRGSYSVADFAYWLKYFATNGK
jgi:peptidoglycan/xylan/chitin deacetylase (PgdA/CDA1 family)